MRSRSYFKEWYEKRADCCPIENNGAFRSVIFDDKNFHVFLAITKDNREEFKRIFGKPDTYWKGSEHYFHIWIREFEGDKFLIMTAKGKGTCIEICDTSFDQINKKGHKIIRFVEDLYFRLKGDVIRLL